MVAPGQEKDLKKDPDGNMEEEHECSDAQEVFDKWIQISSPHFL